MRLSLVTPLYRSAPHIEELYRRAVAVMTAITPDYEIIFVNDGSPDDGLEIAKRLADTDPRVTVIDLSRNFGQHPATVTGLRASSGDYVFLCDSDLEEEPEWIATFCKVMQTESCDVVYGVQTGRKGGPVYRACRRVFYKLINILSGARFPENVVTARLVSRRYLNALLAFEEREVFMAGIWHMVGFKQVAVPVTKRDTSATTYTFGQLASVFINGVTSFSTRPLQIISVAGIVISATALVFILFLVYRKIATDVAAEGWTSVIATIMLLGGIILFFNGIMAIYIAKIYTEVKRRPHTTVRQVYRAGGHDERVQASTVHDHIADPVRAKPGDPMERG
jgi:putative glycosyltransferase